MNPLDRPVWHTLTHAHKALSTGDDRARRFISDVNKFVSGPDDAPETMQCVAQLLGRGEEAYILQVEAIEIPPGLIALKQALGVQMVFEGDRAPAYDAGGIERLGASDAADMLALATLTEPGPFLPRTHEMGDFFGVRIKGGLAAMAGTRMRFPGYCEVSGFCTHPDVQGRGLAKRLSAHVTHPYPRAWRAALPACLGQ